MDLKILQKKLEEIKKMGFVETHRSGNTGIGKTLEDLLKIKENNFNFDYLEWEGIFSKKITMN